MADMTKGEKTHLAKSIISDKDSKVAKLHHINIEPAKNGFIVEAHHHKPPVKGKEHMADYDHDVTRSVHESAEEAAECVKDHCDTHMKAHGGKDMAVAASNTAAASPLEK